MAIGEKAYRTVVPEEAKQLAADMGLGRPNQFIAGGEAPPYLPDSVRSILEMAEATAEAVPKADEK